MKSLNLERGWKPSLADSSLRASAGPTGNCLWEALGVSGEP